VGAGLLERPGPAHVVSCRGPVNIWFSGELVRRQWCPVG